MDFAREGIDSYVPFNIIPIAWSSSEHRITLGLCRSAVVHSTDRSAVGGTVEGSGAGELPYPGE